MNYAYDIQRITSIKKQLCDAILANDYNLLCNEVIDLSITLDQMMLPLFKEQLIMYHNMYPNKMVQQ